jgi:hypothetical protein
MTMTDGWWPAVMVIGRGLLVMLTMLYLTDLMYGWKMMDGSSASLLPAVMIDGFPVVLS